MMSWPRKRTEKARRRPVPPTPVRFVIHEGARHQPFALVGSGNELECRIAGHWVHRQPHADILAPFDIVIRLVLMLRRALAGARLLDEQRVVIEACMPTLHELGSHVTNTVLENEAALSVVFLSVTEVLEEPTFSRNLRKSGLGALSRHPKVAFHLREARQ